MKKDVYKIINEKIRPKLKKHGGDIEIIDIKKETIIIKLLGKCSGCPASNITKEYLIEDILKNESKEIKEVKIVNEVSTELLDMAKKILNIN